MTAGSPRPARPTIGLLLLALSAGAAAVAVAVRAVAAGVASPPGTIVVSVDWPQGLDWGTNAATETLELCAVTTGGHASRLTESEPGVALVDPAWATGGSTVAATASVAGLPGTAVVFRRVGDGPASPSIAGAAHPSISPDGGSVAFDVADPGGSGRRIAIAHVDGTHRTTVTAGPGSDTDPSWSPDGTTIAFSSTRAGGLPQLYVVHPDGSGERRVTRSPTADTRARWSPDGTTLRFAAVAGGRATLTTVTADGSDRRSLGIASRDGAFSPDGRSLAFVLADGSVRIADAAGRAAPTSSSAAASATPWSGPRAPTQSAPSAATTSSSRRGRRQDRRRRRPRRARRRVRQRHDSRARPDARRDRVRVGA